MGIVRTFLLAWLVVPLALWAQPVAEIVSIKGKGERSESPVSGWRPAQVRQKLDAGTWLRTLQDSRMALLLADQTNATVDANSTWQLKAAEGAAPRRSIVDFQKGKGRFETKTPGRSFSVTTPAGLAAIRGTEWLVEVDDDGRSAFTVVEGEIELSNALGTLSVGADEQGILERGRAPYKRRVQNARERVQWVSSFTIDPSMYPELRAGGAMASRYAAVLEAFGAGEVGRARTLLASGIGRDEAPASYFLLADIAIYRGNAREAVEWLLKAGVRFPEEPRTPGLLARAYLFADEAALAREAAANARARFPDTLESQLYAGEAARLDGDARLARAALRRATQIAPDDWRAWHALGHAYNTLAQEAMSTFDAQAEGGPWRDLLLADALFADGRLTDAFAIYRSTLEKLPSMVSIHDSIARIYEQTGHADWSAIERRRGVVPAAGCARRKALCHFRAGQYRAALVEGSLAEVADRSPQCRRGRDVEVRWRVLADDDADARRSSGNVAADDPSLLGHVARGVIVQAELEVSITRTRFATHRDSLRTPHRGDGIEKVRGEWGVVGVDQGVLSEPLQRVVHRRG